MGGWVGVRVFFRAPPLRVVVKGIQKHTPLWEIPHSYYLDIISSQVVSIV